MIALPYALGLAATASTYAGGRLAMRFGRRPELLFGLTAGLVIGLALLDLLPEAVDAGLAAYGTEIIFGTMAGGVAVYLLLHRLPAVTSSAVPA